ncbi:MAG: transcriptional repressor LexA [Planctomycetota bacterium]
MRRLTDRQRAILDWIVGFAQEHGMPPTLREIGRQFGISSPGVLGHLRALERKGHLKRGNLGARSIEIPSMNRRAGGDSVRIPKVGRIAAGLPLLAVENIEGSVTVDRSMAPSRAAQYFALEVTGDSMIGDGIHEGDTVIVRKQETAQDGDVVVALVGDEGTLKRFYREKRGIRLQPSNPRMKPIYARDVTIQGVAEGVIRKLTRHRLS